MSKDFLKMTFTKYLKTLTDEELDRRLGIEMADAFRNGELDTSKYREPPRGCGYSLKMLKNDDIALFRKNPKTE